MFLSFFRKKNIGKIRNFIKETALTKYAKNDTSLLETYHSLKKICAFLLHA